MNKAAQDHKNAVILSCIEQGLSPEETAYVFRKHAEVLNACCDALIEEERLEKTGNIFHAMGLGLKGTAAGAQTAATAASAVPFWAIPAAIGLPVGVSMLAGNTAGALKAQSLTPRNEIPIKHYQKADEILRLKSETADILDRVARKDKEQKEKKQDRSVRSLF